MDSSPISARFAELRARSQVDSVKAMIHGMSLLSAVPHYEIRLGIGADIEAVSALFTSHYHSELTSQDPGSADRLLRELTGIKDGSTILVVARADKIIIGAGLAVMNRDFSRYEGGHIRNTGYLSKSVVHKDFRNLGIGRKLVEARLEELKNRGAHVAYSSHHAENIASAKALDACGFEYVATFADPEKRPTGCGMTVVRRLELSKVSAN